MSDTPKTLFEQEIARSEMLANRVAELEKEVRIFSAMNDEKVKLLQGRDQRIEELQKDLAECFRLSGADPDGNEDWRLAPDAVQEVRRLREESDAADSQVLAIQSQLSAAQEALKVPAIRYEQCIAHERPVRVGQQTLQFTRQGQGWVRWKGGGDEGSIPSRLGNITPSPDRGFGR